MSDSTIKMMKNILLLPRYIKRIVAIILDISLCIFCTWLAFYLRLEEFVKISITILPLLFSISLAIPIFWLLGLYRAIFRFAGLSIFFSTAIAICIYGLLYFSIIGIF